MYRPRTFEGLHQKCAKACPRGSPRTIRSKADDLGHVARRVEEILLSFSVLVARR
jgi:hypothetical protein